MKMKESQFLLIKEQLKKLTSKECFYKQKLEGVNVDQIQSQEDFEKLPFTWKGDLREAYPWALWRLLRRRLSESTRRQALPESR